MEKGTDEHFFQELGIYKEEWTRVCQSQLLTRGWQLKTEVASQQLLPANFFVFFN